MQFSFKGMIYGILSWVLMIGIGCMFGWLAFFMSLAVVMFANSEIRIVYKIINW